MKLLGLCRKVSLLVGHRAQCSPLEHLLACSVRRISSFPDWDQHPTNNRVYFSREMNPAELVDVIDHFRENPIFTSILSNKLVGKSTSRRTVDTSTSSSAAHKNPFLEVISKLNPLMLSKAARIAFRSLPELYLDNHLKGIFLGGRISLSNLRIHKPSGNFVFLNMEEGILQELPLVKRSEDLKGLGGLIREIIDILYPGITIPSDLAHWLSVLERPEPALRLIMYHPVFLCLSARFHYHVALDQASRKEFVVGKRVELRQILRRLAKFKSLFGLAALHELLHSQMNKSRKKSKARSKKKTKAKAAKAEAAAAGAPQAEAIVPESPQSSSSSAGAPQAEATVLESPQSSSSSAGAPQAEATVPESPQSSSSADPGSPRSSSSAVEVLNALSGKRKRTSSRKSRGKRQTNLTSSTGSTIQSAEQIAHDRQKQELSDGRDVVSFIRDCPVHGCENMCLNFEFVDVSMLSQSNIVELLHFIFRDYGHEALEAFFDIGLTTKVDIEGLFGEDANKWQEIIDITKSLVAMSKGK